MKTSNLRHDERNIPSQLAWTGILTVVSCMALLSQAATAQRLPERIDLPAAQGIKIGPGVAEELAANGAANVMIALAQPQSLQGLNTASPGRGVRPNLAVLRSEVATLQSGVLASVENIGYQSKFAYSAVPALAGRITSDAALRALGSHPSVVRVDLDVGGTGHLVNSVPLIAADQRHAMGNSGAGVVVAVLDSGLDTDHNNLADNLIAEACFADNNGAIDGNGRCPNGSDRQLGPGAAEDDAGHGSHVTGIITSNGTQGSVGAAPDASIVAVRVTWGPTFNGVFAAFSEIVAGLNYIINNPGLGVQVINMSLGTNALFAGDCDNSAAFNMAGAAAINMLRANGVIAFASAGNNGDSTQMTSPACLSNVISVGASDNLDAPAGFTNSNASTDVFAPGVNVLSSDLANGTTTVSGTSMASPHAAACAALLIQTGEATTPAQIETRLETSAFMVTVPGNGLTFPRIDCAPLANVPPTCNANGPYTAECALTTTLDGTGSSDDNGDPLSYLWTGPFTGGSAVGAMPMVVFEAPTGSKSVSLTVSDGTEDSQCSAQVTVQDTTAPSITPPDDATAECAAPSGTPVPLGTAIATDSCDASPAITNDAPPVFPVGDTTVIWRATDADGNFAQASQTVTVEDTLAPTVSCNAPATIVPPNAPISFTASALDQCEGPIAAEITEFDCFTFTKKGKRIDKTGSCVVAISGDQITIFDSGGVGNNITWTATSTDAAGNTATENCALQVKRSGRGGK
jgi:subtilisin family serine protease